MELVWKRLKNGVISCWGGSDSGFTGSLCKHILVTVALEESTGVLDTRTQGEEVRTYSVQHKPKKKTGAVLIALWLQSSCSSIFFSSYHPKSACVLGCVCLWASVDIKVCSCVPPCVRLLWIRADSEQLHVNECPRLAVIVWEGAAEPSVSRAECFPMRAFCVALNRQGQPGVSSAIQG